MLLTDQLTAVLKLFRHHHSANEGTLLQRAEGWSVEHHELMLQETFGH